MKFEVVPALALLGRRWSASVLAAVILGAGWAMPAGAGTAYWNAGAGAGDLAPTSVTAVPPTVAFGAFARGNNAGTEILNNTTSASTGYSFLLNGASTNASGGYNFGADTFVGTSLDPSTSTYFSVTVTPDPGTSFELTAIGFGTRSTTNGPKAWTLRSSLDNFATDLVTPGTLNNNSTWVYANAPLTTPLIGSAATELRIYGYAVDGPQSFSSNTWRLDDVQVQVVPEPGLAGLAGVVVLAARRRWRRKRPAGSGSSMA